MHDQTPCQSRLASSHHLLHLITSPSLQLLSDHHFSHTLLASSITSLLLVSLSHHPITHRLSFVHAFSHLYHHLHYQHLSQHKNITSSHHHPLFSSSHAMISTLTPSPPPIPTFHAPFLRMSRSVPSHVRFRSLSCQHPFQHVMIRSLTCQHPFLTMQGSVPCHVSTGSIISWYNT